MKFEASLPAPFSFLIKTAKKPVRFCLNLRDKPPAKFEGGLAVNLLGYQVARTLVKRTATALRPRGTVSRESQKYLKSLDQDGIVSIPNFFSEADFSSLRSEFEKLYPHFNVYPIKNSRSCYKKFNGTENAQSPVIRKLFHENKLIYELAQAVSRRAIHATPEVAYFEWLCAEEEIGKPHQFDHEDMLHYDVPYSTVKVFFYLNDVDEKNGAFTYLPGSNRLSLARLKYDYKLSVDHFKNRVGRVAEGHYEPSESELREMGIHEKPMTGKKNTLIIANNLGFHKRQPFYNSQPRQIVYLNFRYLETLGNRFPFLGGPYAHKKTRGV